MKRSQPLIAVWALSCAGLMSTSRARAQTPEAPAPIRFEFRSPRCGSAQEFIAKVQQRSSRIRLTAEAAADRVLIVQIQPPDAAGALTGSVTVIEPNGATRPRRLKAKSCDEAMTALSLIATVTLDPEALLSEPANEPPPSPPEAAPATTPRKAAPAAPPRPEPPRAAPLRERHRLRFGVEVAALASSSPQPALGGGASAALELNLGQLLSPLFRLSFTHAQLRNVAVGRAGEANFAFTVPALELCPVRLGPRVVGLRPCAYASLGLLEVWGSGPGQSESHRRAFGSAGAGLVLSVRLSEVLEIIAAGRGGLPFLRDDFAFDDVVFFKTRTLVFSAAVGLAVGFP